MELVGFKGFGVYRDDVVTELYKLNLQDKH